MNLKLFIDLETTGLDINNDEIIQIAGIIEKDNEVIDAFDIKMRPQNINVEDISDVVLELQNITRDEIKSRQPQSEGYAEFVSVLNEYINRFQKNKTNRDKFVLIGHNIARFDVPFLHSFFEANDNKFLRSYYGLIVDTCIISQWWSSLGKLECDNTKLEHLCEKFDIELKDSHDALNDVIATRELYHKLNEKINV